MVLIERSAGINGKSVVANGTYYRLRLKSYNPVGPMEIAVLTVNEREDEPVETLLHRRSRHITENKPPIMYVVIIGIDAKVIVYVPKYIKSVSQERGGNLF